MKENVWFSSLVKHKELDIVQKMQRNLKAKDKKLEEYEKRLVEIDNGKAQEELRKREREIKEFNERKKKEENEDLDMRTVRIESFPHDITEEDLREVFSPYGKVWKIRIPVHYDKDGKPTKRIKGFAFINFEYEESAAKCVNDEYVECGFAMIPVSYARKARDH